MSLLLAETLRPTVNFFAASTVYVEGSAAVLIAPSAAISDPDSPDFSGGVLQVTISNNGSTRDVLDINNQGMAAGEIGTAGNSVFYGGTQIGSSFSTSSTLTVTLNSNATAAATQALLRNITFSITGQDPPTATRTVTVELSDGDGGLSSQDSKFINVNIDNIVWVNTTSDTSDGDTSSIFNLLANRGADGAISLREAILATNATASSINEINFAISGAGPHTITVNTELPSITRQLVIDGKTQNGYYGHTAYRNRRQPNIRSKWT